MESETGLREELEEILVRLEALRVSVESSDFDANFAGARFNNCLTTAGSSLKAAQAVLRE
ncbi:MAG: hypothetical protein ACR2GU_15800 [Rubrobacteraceae bacterium]